MRLILNDSALASCNVLLAKCNEMKGKGNPNKSTSTNDKAESAGPRIEPMTVNRTKAAIIGPIKNHRKDGQNRFNGDSTPVPVFMRRKDTLGECHNPVYVLL